MTKENFLIYLEVLRCGALASIKVANQPTWEGSIFNVDCSLESSSCLRAVHVDRGAARGNLAANIFIRRKYFYMPQFKYIPPGGGGGGEYEENLLKNWLDGILKLNLL